MTRLPNGLSALASSLLLATLAVLAAPFALAGQAPVPKPPTVPTNGYILIDHDSGRVLADMRSSERMEPASIT